MARALNGDLIYNAVDYWKSRCLIEDGSIFGSDRLWVPDHIAELFEHFVNKPDEGDRKFLEKLEDQLAPTSAKAKQLAAEILWAMMLFPSDTKREAKTRLVSRVWGWSGVPLRPNHPHLQTFAQGIGSTRPGYNNYRPFELELFVRFLRAWKAKPDQDRRLLLQDAWAFATWFDQLPQAKSRQLRHILLHLLFPLEFERVSSGGEKRLIDTKLSQRLPPEFRNKPAGNDLLSRDQRLLTIRQYYEMKMPGRHIDFYETPEIAKLWRTGVKSATTANQNTAHGGPSARKVAEKLSAQRSWAIGAAEGAVRWPSFYERSQIAIGWDELGDLTRFKTKEEVRDALKEAYGHQHDPWNDALACLQFCSEMRPGDEVFVKQGRNRILGYGRVTGEYEYDETLPDYRNVRQVEWVSRGNWTLPLQAQVPPKTLTEVTSFPDFLEFIRPLVKSTAGKLVEKSSRYTVDDALQDAFVEREELERILASLKRRRNVILQGSPGVGKTFLARRLAYALIGAKRQEHVQMVQFHQSYAYEDFIQGWRPSEDGRFTLKNGVFYEFCRQAQSDPDQPYVFIIDEVNRGNLSKVFGELLLLIEADKRGPEFAIPLTYSESGTDTFHVPANLYLIGLMNTADRSLAMVDYALRRRFAFHTLQPAFDSPAFHEALRSRGVDEDRIAMLVERVALVNQQIVEDHKSLGPGFAIGHSYFCPAAPIDDAQKWYEAVIHDEIRPLLEEYWFDNPGRVDRCIELLLK